MKNLSNRIQLIGNLGTDPEVKELDGGKLVANISMATDETFTDDKGRKIKDTQWHRLVAWDTIAENVGKYLKKGHRVAVEGKLIYRSYEDKEKITRYIAEIIVSRFLKLTPKDKV